MRESVDRATIESLAGTFKFPVAIISSIVGRGDFSVGAALAERLAVLGPVYHFPVEEYLPERAVNEDLHRYRMISDNFRFLLQLIYRMPVFYYRKYLREKLRGGSDLTGLKRKLAELKPETVICVSHRPAFWVSCLKQKEEMDFRLWGVCAEYGKNLGWKYIFWEVMDGFMSGVGKDELEDMLPSWVKFVQVELPAMREYYEISQIPGDRNTALLVCGFWGQGKLARFTGLLSRSFPALEVIVVCGQNRREYDRIKREFKGNPRIRAEGEVESLAPFLKQCSCIITKPGLATLLEAHAAGRKILLLKGMPVAEDNNARYALENFGAQWFSLKGLKRWLES